MGAEIAEHHKQRKKSCQLLLSHLALNIGLPTAQKKGTPSYKNTLALKQAYPQFSSFKGHCTETL